MKRKAVAMVMGVLMVFWGAGSALAEMVDIGTGRMDQTEFAALQAMMQGKPAASRPTVSTTPIRLEQYGDVALTPAEFNALRDRVAGRNANRDVAGVSTTEVQMVDIGTGQMPVEEFAALKRLMQGADRRLPDGLAALQF
jgi:hypothetical protein